MPDPAVVAVGLEPVEPPAVLDAPLLDPVGVDEDPLLLVVFAVEPLPQLEVPLAPPVVVEPLPAVATVEQVDPPEAEPLDVELPVPVVEPLPGTTAPVGSPFSVPAPVESVVAGDDPPGPIIPPPPVPDGCDWRTWGLTVVWCASTAERAFCATALTDSAAAAVGA